MPHATHFHREFPLYLNYGNYEGRWLVSDDSQQRSSFNWRPDPVTKVEQLIDPWRQADAAGLCAPEVLEIFNSVFRCRYVCEDTANAELHRLFMAVEKRIRDERGVPVEAFKTSPFIRFPLYHFVSQGW